jgi:hypothetical protein
MAKKTTTKAVTKTVTKKVAAKAAASVKKVEAPKAVAPKAVTPKAVAPKVVTPKVVAPKVLKPVKTAAKKAVAPKAVTPKVEKPVKVPAKKAVAPKKAAAKAPAKQGEATHIIARVDIGFGNSLYLRGSGAGLSWEKGVALDNVSDYEWSFTSATAKGEVTFKFLINDELWAEGENLVVAAGSTSISSPVFAG